MNQESYQSDKHSATSHRIFPLNNSLFAVKSWCPNHEGAMFFRTKTSGPRSYLQIVENRWEDGRPRQRVIATLGRLDHLQQSGQLDALLVSGARLAQSVLLLSAHAKGQLPTITTRRIGPALIIQRPWEQTGCRRVIEQLLHGRRFEFDVERAVFLTVLHRLFAPGSDRAADTWKTNYHVDGCESLQLHHLYRAMAWLGEELPRDQQAGKTPFAPRKRMIPVAAVSKTASRRGCSTTAAISSPISHWSSSTRPRSIARARVVRTSASAASARTIGPTCTRWSWGRCSMVRGGRSAANCGPAIPPT